MHVIALGKSRWQVNEKDPGMWSEKRFSVHIVRTKCSKRKSLRGLSNTIVLYKTNLENGMLGSTS